MKELDEKIKLLAQQAKTLLQQHNPNGILELLSDVVVEEFNHPELYAWRAKAYRDLKDTTAAENSIIKAMELSHNNATTYQVQGDLKYDAGLYLESLEDYNKAIELNPNFAYAYFCRARTYHVLGHFAEATRDVEKSQTIEELSKPF